jgi:UDP-glucose 4-epimerase
MTKRILVTGGGGFIGRELTRKLVLTGYDVVCVDLGEQFQRQEAFFADLAKRGKITLELGTILDHTHLAHATRGVDAVFHLAAMLGVKRTEDHRLRCMEINVTGTDNLLAACALNRVGHVVFASSSEVYGEPNRNPISETDDTKGKTVYAVSKLAAEELVKGYNQSYPALDYTIVRFFNTYGEGQVAQFFLSRMVKQVLEGQNPTVYGDGTQRRSFGHVDDITDGLLTILRNPAARGRIYNLGNSGQVYSLAELAQKVIDVLAPASGLTVAISGSFDGTDRTADREIFTRYCDTGRAATELGFAPRITVEEGIRRIAAAGSIQADWAHRA